MIQDCESLAFTGAAFFGGLALTIVALLVGAFLLGVAKARQMRVYAAALMLLIVIGAGVFSFNSVPTAQAAESRCTTSDQTGHSPYTATQTSAVTGLAPGVAPIQITGTIANNTQENRYITSVTVSITSVSPATRSLIGGCDQSDFIVFNPTMPIRKTLGVGGSTTFAGASIQFNDKSVNQDACKGSSLTLNYETQ